MEQGLQLCAFTDILSQLPGLHWWQSPDSNSYAFAPACHSLVGAAAPLSPFEWQRLIHPHDRPRRKAALQLKSGQEKTIKYRLLTENGTYQWVQESVKFISSADEGDVLISSATVSTEPLYRNIFNNSSSLLLLLDADGRVEEVNLISEKYLGQKWEQLYEMPLWDIPSFKQVNSSRAIKEAVLKAAGGDTVSPQEWVFTYSGIPYKGKFTIKPVYDNYQQLDYLLIEGTEIAQKEEYQAWNRLADEVPPVLIRYDRSLNCLYVNPAIEAFTGRKSAEFIGKSAKEFKLIGLNWDGFEKQLHEALQSRQMQTYSGWVNTPEQQARHIYSLFIPEPASEGKEASVLVTIRDVTALAQQESKLKQSNTRLRAILEGTRDLIYAFDTNYRLIAFNAAYQKEMKRAFGVAVKQGLSLNQMLGDYPAELKNAKDLLDRALSGEEFTILQEFGDPNRERNYYEISFSTIRNEAGQTIGVSSRTRSLNQEQEIQKELKDAHEFLVLAENLPQIIFTARPDGQIDYLNQAFFEYTSHLHPLAEQVDWKRIVHPDDYHTCLRQWLAAVNSNSPGLQLELRLRSRHGLYRWHIARAVPIFNALNHSIKWVGVISDIHEAKIASELERLAAEEFQTIAESLPHIVWTTRADGRAIYFNQKWYDYTGMELQAAHEPKWISYLHPEDQSRTQKSWHKAVNTVSNYQIEYRLRHKSGRYRWFLARGVPVTDTDGNVVKWFGTCTDIHENKLQRKRLQTQNERLHQINQYLDNFVHAAAHDLRSPVANMKGLLQLLRVHDVGKSKSAKVVESMEISLYRLDNTLQAMIHSIELQSLKQSPAKAMNLAEVFMQVHQEFNDRLQLVPHELDIDFSNCSDIVFIPFYLESLFRNLLSNAIKYRKEGEKLLVRVRCRPYRNYKLVEFSDNGIGIDVDKYKDKLFRPFQRFTQQAGGKGIGLHLINNIVTKTGGKIEVKSKPGEGTTFMMYLKDLEAPKE